MGNGSATSITTQNQFVPAAGTYTGTTIQQSVGDWTGPSGSGITYSYSDPKLVKINATVCWLLGSQGLSQKCPLAIGVNSVPIGASISGGVLDDQASSYPRTASVTAVALLSPGDVVSLMVANLTTTLSDITVECLSMVITEL